jgi:hypothetical protein
MTPDIPVRRVLATFVLGTVAPLALAQVAPGSGQHGHGGMRDNPQWQDCKKQADEKRLPHGDERKSFLEQCVKAAADSPKP